MNLEQEHLIGRAIFREANDAFLIVHPKSREILDVNPAVQRLTGLRRKQLVGSSLEDLLEAEDSSGREQVIRACQTTTVFSARDGYLIKTETGALRPVSVSVSRIHIEPEPLVLLVLCDISERIRAEQERRELEAKVQHAQKLESLGVLAGGIAHDFNNLLTSVLGYADLALTDLPKVSPVRPFLEQVVKAANQAADLTDQMLAYAGKGRFVTEPVDLSALAKDMTRLLHVSISKKCTLQLQLSPSLPRIQGDLAQLRQVIMNLVINASEAIGEQTGTITVSAGVQDYDSDWVTKTRLTDELAEGRYVYLKVADTGCGMSPETLKKIFDPFFTTKFTGRGLGLAAVLGIVRGHQGAIACESELQKGTTFTAFFPTTDDAPTISTQQDDETTPWRDTGLILVVDDEESVRNLACQMLEQFGFTVLMAANGYEGIERLADLGDRIRLVLLDMTMPHLDGAETFIEMQHIHPDVRVVLMSGYNEQTTLDRFAGQGLVEFLRKPFRSKDLAAVVQKGLAE